MTRVLLDEYSHAECMAMLRKAPSVTSNARAIRIATIKKDMPNAPAGVRPALLAELAALTIDVGLDTKARRLDLLIETFDGKIAFVDNFSMSTTAASYLTGSASFAKKFGSLAIKERETGIKNPLRGENTPGFRGRTTKKVTTYKALLEVAELQVADGARAVSPCFFAPGLSLLGEVSSSAFALVGFLHGAHLRLLSASAPRWDGKTPAVVAKAARRVCFDNLACVTWRGAGALLRGAGVCGGRFLQVALLALAGVAVASRGFWGGVALGSVCVVVCVWWVVGCGLCGFVGGTRGVVCVSGVVRFALRVLPCCFLSGLSPSGRLARTA